MKDGEVSTSGIKAGPYDYAISASYGNDSIALIRWAHERGLERAIVIFSDTGWAAPFWLERVERGEKLARSYGFATKRIESMGMRELVRRRKGWPRNGMQFCTRYLKLVPFIAFMDSIDPAADTLVMLGVRRAESSRRSTYPELAPPCDDDCKHDHEHKRREYWAPLVRHCDRQRDDLIRRAGFEVLGHRSQECYPCVNASRKDLRMVSQDRAEEIAAFEEELGYTKNGKLRTIFRPKSKKGAIGFREVMRWAWSEHGKYRAPETGGGGCSTGMCETGETYDLFNV